MSATNKTTYYELPVFIATDEPKWLTDWNGAMNIIDGAIAEAKTAADNAQTTANANALAISGLSDSVSTISTALGTLTTTVNTLNGTVNTITELIGNGTPTTTDKTIIGAINELKAEIDALAPGGAVQADEVEYDNTTSGLVADDVQDAIDELNTKIEAIQPGGGGADLNFVTAGTFTVTASSLFTPQADDRSVVKYLVNTDKSIGKVYGSLFGSVSSGATTNTWVDIATLTAAGVLPTITAAYNVEIGGAIFYSGNSTKGFSMRLHFNTDGTVTLQAYSGSWADANYVMFSLPPCIYVLQNLGD